MPRSTLSVPFSQADRTIVPNAIFDICGKRIRELPILLDKLL
jgi:hypothetical protein